MSNLLSSDFPALTRCELQLGEAAFDLPETFLSGTSFPAVRTFVMDGLSPEAAEQLSRWMGQRGIGARPTSGSAATVRP